MAPKRKKKQQDAMPTRRSKRCKEASVKKAIASVNEKDWRLEKNLSESQVTMFKDEICCDVQFLCGEKEEVIKAHKFVLICRSSVFFAMFEGPASSNEDDIKVPDISPDIFRSFLQFLYSDKIDLNEDTLMHIMYAGQKYQVHSLINECTKFVEKNLTLDNACLFMEGAHMYSEPALQGIVLQFIEDNAVAIMRSTTMRDLCSECFGKILDSNNLNGNYAGEDIYSSSESESELDDSEEPAEPHSEENRQEDRGARNIRDIENPPAEGSNQPNDENHPKAGEGDDKESGGEEEDDDEDNDTLYEYVALENSVFEALLYWARGECKKHKLKPTRENCKKVAENLIHKVRYNLITSDFMVTIVADSGLLSPEERCKALEYMLQPHLTRNVFWNTDERGPHAYNTWFPRFKRESENSCVPIDETIAISFRCFEDLYFHGFSLYGSCRPLYYSQCPDKFSVLAKICDETGKVLDQKQEEYQDRWLVDGEEHSYYDTSTIRTRDDESQHNDVLLRRKLKLQKNKTYSIVVELDGIETYSGRSHMTIIKGGDDYERPTYDIQGANTRNLIEFHNYNAVGYYGQTCVSQGQISRVGLSRILPGIPEVNTEESIVNPLRTI